MQFLSFFDWDVDIFIVVVAFAFQFIGQKRFDFFIEIFLFDDLQNIDQSWLDFAFHQNLVLDHDVYELGNLMVFGMIFEEHFDDLWSFKIINERKQSFPGFFQSTLSQFMGNSIDKRYIFPKFLFFSKGISQNKINFVIYLFRRCKFWE